MYWVCSITILKYKKYVHKVINTPINKIIYYSMYMKKVVGMLCTKRGGGGRMNVSCACVRELYVIAEI